MMKSAVIRLIGLLFGVIATTLFFSNASAGIESRPGLLSDNRLSIHKAISTPTIESMRKVMVVYFSRSGNTQLMATEIADYYRANLLPIEAEDYPVGVRGLFNAVLDSQNKQAFISPDKVDLSVYDTVFIGAPIWRDSPAPPVWQFIANNNLANKDIVLFSTFNSGFKQKYIDEFQALVEARGGHFISHLYIRRGRMMAQISGEELLQKTRQELDKLVL